MKRPRVGTVAPALEEGLSALFKAFVDPVSYLSLHVSHSSLAQAYPLGEFPCRLETAEVLE